MLRACLKIPWGPVFGEKAGWRGATTGTYLQRSVTEEQRSQPAFWAKTLRAAGLLSGACVGSVLTARCGDAPASPPWPQPKSLAAGPHAILKQALSRIHSFAGGLHLPVFMAMAGIATTVRAAAPFPEAAQLPLQTTWPNPLAAFQGAAVTTKKLWVTERRPELKELFQHYMYGKMPPSPKIVATLAREDKGFFGGKATLKEVTIALGPPAAPRIHLLLVVPNHHRKAAPVFLGLSFCGNHALVTDTNVALPTGWMPKSCAGCADNRATEAGRSTQVDV